MFIFEFFPFGTKQSPFNKLFPCHFLWIIREKLLIESEWRLDYSAVATILVIFVLSLVIMGITLSCLIRNIPKKDMEHKIHRESLSKRQSAEYCEIGYEITGKNITPMFILKILWKYTIVCFVVQIQG